MKNKKTINDWRNEKMKDLGIYDVDDITYLYSGYFFSKEAMASFKSRLLKKVYFGHDDTVYFITSERDDWQNTGRRYTVRRFNKSEKTRIRTEGEFSQLSKREAQRIASELEKVAYEMCLDDNKEEAAG